MKFQRPAHGILLSLSFFLASCGGSAAASITPSGSSTLTPVAKDSTPPTAPSALKATVISSTQINLSWTASTDNVGVKDYLIERCTGAACTSFAQIATSTTVSFANTGLLASTSYSYRVRASDAAGNLSAYSAAVAAKTDAPPDKTPPTAPSALKATVISSTQINLSWTASTDNVGVKDYLIERCTGAACTAFAQIATSTTVSFASTGLLPMTSYSYRVRASDAAGNLSAYSATVSAKTTADTTPPSAPSALKATVISSTQINLAWTASTDNVGVTSYRIERCTGAACTSFAQIATSTTVSYANTGLLASTSYSYRVRASDAAGNLSAYSATVAAKTDAPPDKTPPTAPSALKATVISSTQINLAWTASTDNVGVTGYRIERCTGAACTSFAQIATSTTVSFANTGLLPVTSYSYRVRASDAAGNLSAYSATVSAKTTADTTPPTAPSALKATVISSTEINLAWTASTDNVGVTGYRIERCTGAACTAFAQIATSTTVSLANTGLLPVTSYSYRVRASDAAGNLSAYSATVSAKTTADTTPPTAPSALKATVISSTEINLAWTASTDNVGVTGYRIERCTGAACTAFAQIATSTTVSFANTGLLPVTSYSYRVRASDAAGNLSPYSATVSAKTTADTTPPTAPSALKATVISSTEINLAWTASTDNVGVTGYRIERCTGAACTAFAQIATSTTVSYANTGLIAGTSYSYRVRASDAAGNFSSYSNVASTVTAVSTIAVSVTPVRGGLTVSQTLSLTATLVNDTTGAGVTWSATAGSFSAKTATTAVYVAPATAGQVTITATSAADPTKSASAVLGVTDLTLVGSYHNDGSRDGANTHEFALTTANVNTTSFGKLFSCTVDGAIYAQPLWIANLTINGVRHNVVVVATMHDSVYAFDADAAPCVTLWHANLLDAAHGAGAGETSVPSGTANSLVGDGSGDIKPEIGVTGTPVIDPSSNTVYMVSKSAVANALPIYQRLHGLSLLDGSERAGGPAKIDSSIAVAGTGDGGSQVQFNAQTENQRPGLALANGVVYITWASHEDAGVYHGWVIGFNASTLALAPNAVLNTTPNQVSGKPYSRGGIWMSGAAPAVDSSNNLYLATANGSFDANSGGSNFSDSTLKLSTSSGLAVASWFAPADQDSLDDSDKDHGAGGAALLVNAGSGSYIIQGGKEGTLFLLSQTNLGGYGANVSPANSNARQNFNIGHGIFCTPAFWNNALYLAGYQSGVQSYSFDPNSGLFNEGATSIGSHVYGWPGASPSISASGTTNGIAWALDTHPYCTAQSSSCGSAVLYAMDATQLSTELWNSSLVAADAAGNAVKFTVPTVANGKVYVGTRGSDTGSGTAAVLGELDVYGLKPH